MTESNAHTRTTMALVVGGSLALLLLADVPGAFSAGFVLRGFLLAVAAAVAVFAFGCQRAGPFPVRRLDVVLALLPAGIALLGLLTVAEDGWAAWLRHAAPWFALALLPLAFGRALVDDHARRLALQIAGGAVCAAALWTLIDALQRGTGGAGPFGRPGVAGPVLAALSLPTLAALGRTRLLRIVIAVGMGLSIVSTRSRVALIAWAIGMAAWFVFTRPTRNRARWTRAVAAGLAVCFLYGSMALAGSAPLPGGRDSADVRMGLHRASFALIREAPLRGQGLGRYGKEVLRVRDLHEAQLESGRRPTHAHDDYVHTAVEVGLFGGVLLFFFVVGMLLRSLRAIRARRVEPDHGLRVACWAGLVVLAVAAWGDGVLIDPAGVIAFTLCAAPLWGSIARPTRNAVQQVRLRQLAWLLVPILVGCAWLQGRALAGDAAYMDYVTTSRPALERRIGTSLDDLAREQLANGALRYTPDDARAWYQLGVHRARKGEFIKARDSFRQAIRHDPGMTEARLDLATVYERQDRPVDARDVLVEARRWDPTRFDVALRLGHLALGPEPLAGDPLPEVDIEAIFKRYNVARALNPKRIENLVSDARIARRLGETEESSQLLLKAMLSLNVGLDRAPPEILLETFRLAEADGKPALLQASYLVLALNRDPRLAGLVRQEAWRWLELGEARESDAKATLEPGVAKLDDRASQRAYDAAVVRYSGLLLAGLEDPAAFHYAARAERDQRRNRRALARYRALLAWSAPSMTTRESDKARDLAVGLRGEMYIEAAIVAKPVDDVRAARYYDRGQALIGLDLLGKGSWKHAARQLRNALENNPGAAHTRLALAQALMRDGKEEDAVRELVRALTDDPTLRNEAHGTLAFKPLQAHPSVRDALGLPD